MNSLDSKVGCVTNSTPVQDNLHTENSAGLGHLIDNGTFVAPSTLIKVSDQSVQKLILPKTDSFDVTREDMAHQRGSHDEVNKTQVTQEANLTAQADSTTHRNQTQIHN